MNAGEAIGLLVGLGDPVEPDQPLLLQEWNWTKAIAAAIDKSSEQAELRGLVYEAINVILDLPPSKPGEVHDEILRRRDFNEIRRGVRR